MANRGNGQQAASKPLQESAYQKVLDQLQPARTTDSSGATQQFTLEKVLRKAQQRSAHMPQGKNGVFYYPACEFDWEPIYRFSGACDTFIYCDYGVTLEAVVDKLRKGYFSIDHAELIPQDFVQAMTRDSVMPAGRRMLVEPWGCLFTLTCGSTKSPKSLHLLYLAVEGVTFYENLFARHAHQLLVREWAPEYLCIRSVGFGDWARFYDWQEPLGRAVDRNKKNPKYVEHDRCQNQNDYNWPWSQQWLAFNTGRKTVVCYRPNITPTEREGQNFRLPRIPPAEWPEITDVPPLHPLG